jgi:hypothetical protein
MLKKFEDLRFSIGAFFLITGILIVIAGATQVTDATASFYDYATGAGLIAFAVLAIVASYLSPNLS